MIRRLNSWLLPAVLLVCVLWSASRAQTELSGLEINGARFDYQRWNIDVVRNGFTLTYKARVTIVNERGTHLSTIHVDEPRFSKVRSITARLLNAEGKVVSKKDKSDFGRLCGWDYISLYSDVCYYQCDLSLPSFPYTIEYEYSVDYETLLYLPSLSLQRTVDVIQAEVVVTAPLDRVLCFQSFGFEIPAFEEYTDRQKVTSFTYSNIPALEPEDFVPGGYQDPMRLVISADSFKVDNYYYKGDTWQNVGKWYGDMAKTQYLPGAETTRRAPPDSANEVLWSVYEDIVRNVRYVSIAVGIGGWQPNKSEDVQRLKFGDCKDMTTLLVSQLRLWGIRAYPALVRTRDLGPLDETTPAPRFNHVIAVVQIDEDTIWMDPTCDGCPPGELPYGDEGLTVLAVTDSGGELWHTPMSCADDNLTVREGNLTIDAAGSVDLSATMTYRGNSAVGWRESLLSPSRVDLENLANSSLEGGAKNFKITETSYSGISLKDSVVQFQMEARSRKPVDDLRGVKYCRPFVFSWLSDAELEDLSSRTSPLHLWYPDRIRDIITVSSNSPGLTMEAPADDSLSSAIGDLKLTSRYEDGKLTLTLDRSIHVNIVMPEQFGEFEEIRKRLKSMYGAHIRLVSAEQAGP